MQLAGFVLCLSVAVPQIAFGDVVVAARTIRSQSTLVASDLRLEKTDPSGEFTSISELIGLETRVVIYQGRPISSLDVGPAAIIERNQIVTLVFANGPLVISADGRSLGRAGVGDLLKVMNLSSRKTVTGYVNNDGTIAVGKSSAGGLR